MVRSERAVDQADWSLSGDHELAFVEVLVFVLLFIEDDALILDALSVVVHRSLPFQNLVLLFAIVCERARPVGSGAHAADKPRRVWCALEKMSETPVAL